MDKITVEFKNFNEFEKFYNNGEIRDDIYKQLNHYKKCKEDGVSHVVDTDLLMDRLLEWFNME